MSTTPTTSTHSQAVSHRGNQSFDFGWFQTHTLARFGLGLGFLIVAAQLRLENPWTPVPITLQSLAVIFLGLKLGRRMAVAVGLTYLSLGLAGLPVFSGLKAWSQLGLTGGYLLGMVAAAYLVGGCRDLGITQKLAGRLLAIFAGMATIYLFGVAGLTAFMSLEQALQVGLYPFALVAVAKAIVLGFLVR